MSNSAIRDNRDPRYIGHEILDLFRQRIYQIVAGYEDCNDANLLRRDPVLKAVCDRLLNENDLEIEKDRLNNRLDEEVHVYTSVI